jgi:hypothetical protein
MAANRAPSTVGNVRGTPLLEVDSAERMDQAPYNLDQIRREAVLGHLNTSRRPVSTPLTSRVMPCQYSSLSYFSPMSGIRSLTVERQVAALLAPPLVCRALQPAGVLMPNR